VCVTGVAASLVAVSLQLRRPPRPALCGIKR